MKKLLTKQTKLNKFDSDEEQVSVQHVAGAATSITDETSANEVPMKDILTLAQKLIEIRSTEDDLHSLEEVCKIVGEQASEFTIETFIANGKPSLLIHNANPGTKFFKIILNAHLDVIPGKGYQFKSYIKDGKLFGRGAYDMKATAATMLYVFKEMATKVSYPLALQIVADEEQAEGTGTRNQLTKGIRTDMAILGECGSNLDIIYENKGLVHATITTTGNTAHGAYPWNGQNAIMEMHKVLSLIHQHFPIPEKETFETTITISKITTDNEAWNKVPDSCTATLDIRSNHKNNKTALEELEAILPDDVIIEVVKERTPFYTDPNNAYINQLVKAAKQAVGKELRKRKTYGGSDANMFADVGCASVEFGPVGSGQHHDDEWVDIKSLGEYYLILKNFLLSIK